MAVYCKSFVDVRTLVSNQYSNCDHNKWYQGFLNRHPDSKFPTGFYNKCGKYQAITEQDTDEYTTEDEDNLPVSDFVTPTRSKPSTSRASPSPTTNNDSSIQALTPPTDLDL